MSYKEHNSVIYSSFISVKGLLLDSKKRQITFININFVLFYSWGTWGPCYLKRIQKLIETEHFRGWILFVLSSEGPARDASNSAAYFWSLHALISKAFISLAEGHYVQTLSVKDFEENVILSHLTQVT